MKNIPRYILVAVTVWSLTISALAFPTSPVPQTPSDAKAQEKADKEQAKKDKAAKDKEAKEAAAKDKEEKGKGGGILKNPFGGKGDDQKSKEEVKAEKQEREYQKLLANARAKYDQKDKEYNPDFKVRVDQHYKDLLRQHSEQAFLVNTFDTQDERTTFTGDKLKTEDSLYDNPLVQDYVNRVGQSLVPANSPYRYAFKVILSPVPQARSLSTGTIYVSTGLLSVIDNEAQLAYILGHEIAHTEKKHWLQDALVANEMEDAEARRQNIRGAITMGATLGTMFAGGLGKGVGGTVNGLFAGSLLYPLISTLVKLAVPNKAFSWDRMQENEADEEGLKLMFNRSYDPREVPKLYARLKELAEREPRVSDGFMAQTERIGERLSTFNPMLAGQTVNTTPMRGSSNLRAKRESLDVGLVSPLEVGKPFGTAEEAEKREKAATTRLPNLDTLLKEKLDRGEIIGSSAEFEAVMADLKRDNGVRAFYYDMFKMALTNLSEALEIRSNDPYTYFYYGKVLSLTARGPAEKAKAIKAFETAIDLDKRGVLAGPWLHRALALMADRNPEQNREIVGYLKRYVDVYQQEHSGNLPPNMDAIYAYMKDLGEDKWVARPAMNVSTKNIEPLETSPGGRATPQPAISTPISAPPQTTTTPATTPAKNTPATTPAKKKP